MVWALVYLGVGLVWVGICRWWLRRERRTAHPPWFEQDHRDHQVEREVRESKPIVWRR